jgi:hypothetical protein
MSGSSTFYAAALLVITELLSQGAPLVMRMQTSLWLITIMDCNFHENDVMITATSLFSPAINTDPLPCKKHPTGCFFAAMRTPLNCSL